MKLHVVAGFLGSGKTTAISVAAGILSRQGATVSIITNDQGKYLVDTDYVQSLGIGSAEVTGGCFCCQYDQLVSQIDLLRTTLRPSVVFAESVGSCTDLVATVVKPLEKFSGQYIDQISFSTFVDARILLDWWHGRPLPFEPDTNYIWEKQLEEADILVVNKIDLLTASELQSIRMMVAEYPSKTFLLQNSLDTESVKQWLEALVDARRENHRTVEVDYERYGQGEANLAWLDECIEFKTKDASALIAARMFMETLLQKLSAGALAIGHVKGLVTSDGRSHKFSYTTIPPVNPLASFPAESSDKVLLGLNARVQVSPGQLSGIVAESVEAARRGDTTVITEKNLSVFKPGYPQPTHRFA
jgi:G3E family GTPase